MTPESSITMTSRESHHLPTKHWKCYYSKSSDGGGISDRPTNTQNLNPWMPVSIFPLCLFLSRESQQTGSDRSLLILWGRIEGSCLKGDIKNMLLPKSDLHRKKKKKIPIGRRQDNKTPSSWFLLTMKWKLISCFASTDKKVQSCLNSLQPNDSW